jgi:hypothetical protein
MGMGSKSSPGSNALLKVTERPLVEPMALILSADVGGLKFIAKLANKRKKSDIKNTALFILLIYHNPSSNGAQL